MQVLYEDNHIIIVSKTTGEIVQGDKTGDKPLSETVKQYIKEAYAKPGDVFLGVVHRLDRPVFGLVLFARTSKALSRLNAMFANGEVKKKYWAIVKDMPPQSEGTLTHWLVRNEKQNKSYAYDHEVPHHQIRCQLAKMGCPIKGDLKYGAKRSNPDGSISLLSHSMQLIHPVSKKEIVVEAPLPNDNLWRSFHL